MAEESIHTSFNKMLFDAINGNKMLARLLKDPQGQAKRYGFKMSKDQSAWLKQNMETVVALNVLYNKANLKKDKPRIVTIVGTRPL